MPGTGTGEPVYFHCAAYRAIPWSARSGDYAGVLIRRHVVTLTGRWRPYRRRGTGMRTDTASREYRCTCGHVGWSAHIDLARMENVLL